MKVKIKLIGVKGLRKVLFSLILMFLVCLTSFGRPVGSLYVAGVSEGAPTPSPPPLPPSPAPSYAVRGMRFVLRSTVMFVNSGNSTWMLTDEDRAVGLFMNNSWQTVLLINQSHPLEKIVRDEDGNLIAILSFERVLEPGENVSYSVSYNILSRPRTISNLEENKSGVIGDIPEYLREMFCVSAPPWLTEDEEIRKIALSVAGNETNVLRIVKKFVAWIWQNIEYPSQQHEVPFYPNETLRNREGDCDDQAILFVTFCRIFGIPSFVQVGCVYLSMFHSNTTSWDGHVTHELWQIGWHGWAVAYIPPWGWLPVDLTFVVGAPDDPVNAMRYSAVTLREVVQYMNVSETDYVASTREYRDFLQQNGFYLYIGDEMDVTFLGDLNCDFVVNISDVAVVAVAYGSTVGGPNWNGVADVAEPYGLIDIVDVAEVAREFGLRA